MTHDELMDMLIDSNAEDWLRDSQKAVNTFKRDLNVTVRERDIGKEAQYLDEPWAVDLGHERPRIRVYELWYGASYVREFYFASVDGGRAILPYPKASDDLRITSAQFAIGIAVNSDAGRLQEYLNRAHIDVL